MILVLSIWYFTN